MATNVYHVRKFLSGSSVSKKVPEVRPARDLQEDDQPGAMDAESQLPGTKWHGIKIGGIGDRIDVNNVKLGLSSYHGPQSNAGFSRKIDGTYYGS
uniref:Uncharacterized protein n=1 Tax=Rhodnius prolixus TaxID=13249 RepID=T1HXY2_RHOPR